MVYNVERRETVSTGTDNRQLDFAVLPRKDGYHLMVCSETHTECVDTHGAVQWSLTDPDNQPMIASAVEFVPWLNELLFAVDDSLYLCKPGATARWIWSAKADILSVHVTTTNVQVHQDDRNVVKLSKKFKKKTKVKLDDEYDRIAHTGLFLVASSILNNTVVTFDSRGKPLAKNDEIERPSGLCAQGNGHVLVASQEGDCIYLLTAQTGEATKIITWNYGICEPVCVRIFGANHVLVANKFTTINVYNVTAQKAPSIPPCGDDVPPDDSHSITQSVYDTIDDLYRKNILASYIFMYEILGDELFVYLYRPKDDLRVSDILGRELQSREIEFDVNAVTYKTKARQFSACGELRSGSEITVTRPSDAGAGCGQETTCTAGAFLTDVTHDNVYLLTACHKQITGENVLFSLENGHYSLQHLQYYSLYRAATQEPPEKLHASEDTALFRFRLVNLKELLARDVFEPKFGNFYVQNVGRELPRRGRYVRALGGVSGEICGYVYGHAACQGTKYFAVISQNLWRLLRHKSPVNQSVDSKQNTFLQPGDSGCLVVTCEDGEALIAAGIGIQNTTMNVRHHNEVIKSMRVSYIMDMGHVMKVIENNFGLNVKFISETDMDTLRKKLRSVRS